MKTIKEPIKKNSQKEFSHKSNEDFIPVSLTLSKCFKKVRLKDVACLIKVFNNLIEKQSIKSFEIQKIVQESNAA